MKIKFYLSVFLVMTTIFISCKKDTIEYEDRFEKSRKTWMSFKAASNNSYSYTVRTDSWTGFQTETVITILNGEVISRTYVARSRNQGPSASFTIHDEWAEDQNSLNTHTSGAKTMTLDEIYQMAKSELLKKRTGTEIYFESENNGMISSCGYVEDGCQDDCFKGISISNIVRLEVDYAVN